MTRDVALPGFGPAAPPRSTLMLRVLGIYIAAVAGAIQFLDILVDRAGLAVSDRFFMMSVLIGIVGIPCVGAGTAVYSAAAAERRPPRNVPSRTVAPPAAVAPPPAPTAGLRDEPAVTSLPRRLELAISYRRIAQLHLEAGEQEAARSQHEAWLRESRAVHAELKRLIDEA